MKTFDDINRTGNPQNPESEKSFENINEKDELLLFDNGPESPAERRSNEAVKGAAWLLGIVAIFAVAILFAWIVGSHTSPIQNRGADRQLYSQTQGKEAAEVREYTPAQFMAVLIPAGTTKTASAAATSARNVTKASSESKTSSSESKTSSLSAADEDRIEREAREVIHGDFGDNPGRKAKLGADYAAVQARVNEILH